MTRIVPVVTYEQGYKEVVGKAVVEDNGYGSFTIHVGRISDVVSVEIMSMRVKVGEGL